MATNQSNLISNAIQSNREDADPIEEDLREALRIRKVEREKSHRMKILREELQSLEAIPSKSDDTLLLTSMQQELAAARLEIATLRKTIFPQKELEKQPLKWNGECDYNHPGIELFAKTLHKKYKDVELPLGFEFKASSYKGELGEASIIWTNLCTMLRILDSGNQSPEFMELLGIILNVCHLLAEKRDYVQIKNTVSKETADMFKLLKNNSSMMSEKDQQYYNQAVSILEVQARVAPPRQHGGNLSRGSFQNSNNHSNFNANSNNSNSSYNQHHNNNSNNNNSNNHGNSGYRGGRGRGGGNQYQNAAQQYNNTTQPAPNNQGTGTNP